MVTTRRAALANELETTDEGVRVLLSDGGDLLVRFDDHEFLRRASATARRDVVIDEGGTALWWESLLDGISLAGLLGVPEDDLYDVAEAKGRIRFTYRKGRWRD
jgi:hypothetical protein